MPRYQYVKAELKPIKFNQHKIKSNKFLRILPNIMIVIGATAIVTVLYPIVSYNLSIGNWQQATNFKDPSEVNKIAIKDPFLNDPATPVQAYVDNSKAVVISDIDYTKASNWFPTADIVELSDNEISESDEYRLSIPSLNIDNMIVKIDGNNLDKHLIQYPGTAMPGDYGNPVIFGHSVLPLFNNPKSYMSVFTKVPTLKPGDDIYVNYDNVEYRYVVDSYHEVQPEDIEVLEQRYDRKSITLITCVPPGTYLRRGVIQAHLD